MSRGTDPGHFFQTTSSISEVDRRAQKSKNNLGSPIRLSSKLLAIIPDPRSDDAVFVAESAGSVRRVVVNTEKKTKASTETYTGPQAPVTSLAISSDGSLLFAGCWDKSIWSWDIKTRQQRQKYLGHSDFVKCVATARLPGLSASKSTSTSTTASQPASASQFASKSDSQGSASQDDSVLISGSADGAIIVWAFSGEKLHVLKPGSRGVLDLAVCPVPLSTLTLVSTSSGDSKGSANGIDLFSAHSEKAINRFRITVGTATQIYHDETSKSLDLADVHDTSVDSLCFVGVEGDMDLELWTASADKTARGLSYTPCQSDIGNGDRSAGPSDGTTEDMRDRAIEKSNEGVWIQDTSLPHPDFVRCIRISSNRAITACRDENVRVWDTTTGDLLAILEGHFEEVTSLCLLGPKRVVSVSIDGTVRAWDIDDAGLARAKTAQEEWNSNGPSSGGIEKKGEAKKVELTEDEERELAELMDMDDDDD